MSQKSSLVALLDYSRTVEAEFLRELTDPEIEATGAPDQWTAKDLVAHVTTWRERGTEDLLAVRAGVAPPELREFDGVNREIYFENRDQTWDALRGRGQVAWQALASAIAEFPEDVLTTAHAELTQTSPVWRRITVEAGSHPVLHFSEYAMRHGRGDSARRWMEALTPHLLSVDSSPEWHGVVHYNLACHFALSGQAEAALESLVKSLDLNPSLRKWSTQDPDLASLHQDPHFAELTAVRE